jgi:hypothetical protein
LSFWFWMQRNYRFFVMFVFTETILCIYVHAFCWVYITRIMNSEETSIWKAMSKAPASIALVVYTFISVWFVGGLTVFHSYLISKNQVRNSPCQGPLKSIMCLTFSFISSCVNSYHLQLFLVASLPLPLALHSASIIDIYLPKKLFHSSCLMSYSSLLIFIAFFFAGSLLMRTLDTGMMG